MKKCKVCGVLIRRGEVCIGCKSDTAKRYQSKIVYEEKAAVFAKYGYKVKSYEELCREVENESC